MCVPLRHLQSLVSGQVADSQKVAPRQHQFTSKTVLPGVSPTGRDRGLKDGQARKWEPVAGSDLLHFNHGHRLRRLFDMQLSAGCKRNGSRGWRYCLKPGTGGKRRPLHWQLKRFTSSCLIYDDEEPHPKWIGGLAGRTASSFQSANEREHVIVGEKILLESGCERRMRLSQRQHAGSPAEDLLLQRRCGRPW